MDLEHNRHTLAHLLAAAIKEHYSQAKPTIGPAIDTGFYYDFDFGDGEKPGEEDLPKIEETMRQLLPSWTSFTHQEVSADGAREAFKGNPYKLELIDELEKNGETITLYTAGDGAADAGPHSSQLKAQSFTDLCRGGHAENPARDIPLESFTLASIAGAYWRGDESKPMLTRIYGFAFENKEKLDEFLAMREEAEKRDHRKLGREHDLFTFSELVGSGLPLWTPRGTMVRHLLDEFVWRLRSAHGYERVVIPHFTKRELYERSGHWEKFADELFRVTTREGKEFAVKPMNCPHHTQIFARKPHSYREMPQRYAETTMVYRDEQSGELGGLTRVLSITQDDSHVFCRTRQVKEEFFKIWDIVDSFYGAFGFAMRVRLSFHEPSEFDKYLGDATIWQKAEDSLREIAHERNAEYFEAPGEAAMYGPKLDFMARDSMGREHQVATIQLDMNLPERFDLTCINEEGERERIVMIHCAIMGSIERFMAVLLEHLGGVFPFWLSPVQVKVLPIGEAHAEYASKIAEQLNEADIRVELDKSDETLGKKIRSAKLEKVPYFLVIGDKEMESGQVMVESRDDGKVGAMDVTSLLTHLQNS